MSHLMRASTTIALGLACLLAVPGRAAAQPPMHKPVPVLDLQRGDARRALAWLPVVGLLLGACAGAVGSGVVLLSGAQLLAAVLSVVVASG